MRTFLKLFGKSPFTTLSAHMEKVKDCVEKLRPLFTALEKGDSAEIEKISADISNCEHEADMIKANIRNQLPKDLYLPIDKSQLLDILSMQDNIADAVEDTAVLMTLKKLEILDDFKQNLLAFLEKNLETFYGAYSIMKEMHELLESSFGGIEAEKVKSLVEKVAYLEHQTDLLQRKLLKDLFGAEEKLSNSSFYLWIKIAAALSDLSNLSEKLANRVRMTLELK